MPHLVVLLAPAVATLLLLTAVPAPSVAGGRYTLTYGPYLYHFHPRPDHNEYPAFTALSREAAAGWEAGGAYFRNSYDQPSAYLYGGRRWDLAPGESRPYAKLTAGALLGYVGRYEDRIPVNWRGIGLGVIPAVGWQYRRASLQVVGLGVSGVMFTAGCEIWP